MIIRKDYAKVAARPSNDKHFKLFRETEREAWEHKRELWGK